MPLIICPVRPGENNEELRYALRSWEMNLLLEDDLILMTVGHNPNWLSPDIHIKGNRTDSMPLAVLDNILMASEHAVELGHREVIYMNDDFFCLDPVGKVMPVRRNVSLKEQLGVFPRGTSLWWPTSLQLTIKVLAELGHENPHSYEVHRPLPADPAKMVSALTPWHSLTTAIVPQWRTLYGVLNEVEATPVADVKVAAVTPAYGSPWVSTSDQSWRKHAPDLMRRFPEKSHWER